MSKRKGDAMRRKVTDVSLMLCAVVLFGLSAPVLAQNPNRGNRLNDQLTGTYRLNSARSDNVQQAANRATRTLDRQEADRVRASLLRRLEAPEQIALEQ